MKRVLFILSALLIILVGCSTQKNTHATRSFHQTKCKYNIDFNAMNSYNEGMKLINSSGNDDYTHRIEMYPISNPANYNLATSQMDIVILKCRKAIKTHSITKRPKLNVKKKKDPKYAYFYNQEEYVQGVKDAWILLGKAELHKGDFEGAVASFNYIKRHYPSDIKISCQANIWAARAYAESGWLYEAQQSFDAIKIDEIPRSVTQEYTATKAFLLLKEKRDMEALPFLKVATENEKDKYLKARWNLLIGQILFNNGQSKEAADYLEKAIHKSQFYQLEFNARILLLQCEGNNRTKSMKKLEKMAKNENNKDYLDQVYTAIGNLYLSAGDTLKALEAYQLGVDNSTRAGAEKATLLITMGDLYYTQHEYVKAQPCYRDATQLINSSHEDYRRVSKLSETLDLLVQYTSTIELQDSLQKLSTLSEEEQLAIVNTIIEKVKADDAAEAERQKEEETKGFQQSIRPDMSMARGSQEWYFYNAQLIQKGSQIFKNNWGNRILEDDWRRSNKVGSGIGNKNEEMTEMAQDEVDAKHEKENTKRDGGKGEDNPQYDPDTYLAMIPKSDEDFANSNLQISHALYALAMLYDEKLNEYQSSANTHEEFQGRFPNDSMNIESLYSCYRLGWKMNDEQMTEDYKDEIIRRYPNSTYAMMLTDSNYVERMQKMLSQQDSIYEETYNNYCNNNFKGVLAAYSKMQREFPTSPLMPKFAFLSALSIGKTNKESDFVRALQDVVATYPQADVTAMCRDLLALMNQGEKAQQGDNTNLLEQMREEAEKPEDDLNKDFTRDDNAKHALVIVLEGKTQKQAFQVLYDIAAYNFTRFMINGYDLEVRIIDGMQSIIVTEFDSRSNAEWYYNKLIAESTIRGTKFVIISVDDLGIIGKIKTLNDYLQ